MSDEDLRTLLRDFRASTSAELESVQRRVDDAEAGILNELRAVGRHLDRIDRRLESISERLDAHTH